MQNSDYEADDFERFQKRISQKSRAEMDQSAQMMETVTALLQQNAQMMAMLQQNMQGNQQPTNFNVMPDLSKSIDYFDAEKGVRQAQDWLKQLQTAAHLHSWPDAFIFEMARSHLKGAAKFWYSGRIQQLENWHDFKTAFQNTFIFTKSKTELWKNMTSRVQQAKENINMYFHEKVALCRELELSFEELKEQVIIGIWSKDLSNYLMAKNHSDEDELYRDIVSYDRMSTERRTRIEKNFMRKEVSDQESRNSGYRSVKPVVPGKDFRQPLKNEAGQVKCYNCQAFGHISRNCTEPKREIKCFRCGEIGHTPKYCDKPRKMEQGEKKGEVKIFERQENSDNISKNTFAKYVKKVMLNNTNFTAMIDCGSSDCIIKSTAAIMGDFVIEKELTELTGFGQANNIVKSYAVIKTTITVDGVKANDVKFRIVPDDVLTFDVIIGRSFTELPHVVYFKINDKLYFQSNDDTDLPLFMSKNNFYRPEVTENSTIVAGSINFIQTNTCNQDVMLPILNFDKRDIELKIEDKLSDKIYSINEVPEIERNIEEIKKEELNLDKTVTDKQTEELLLLLNDYRDCIAKNIHELGKTKVLEMKIQEKPGSVPVNCKPYKTNARERMKIKEIVSEWKSAGIVEETSSPYASPVLLVTKKTGEARLVIDYRKVNAQTQRINFPLSNLDEHMESLYGSKIFATLDLAHGYLQLPLEKESREKTAFITPDDTGQFTRAMFGLMNAPFYFSKMMSKVLGNLKEKICMFFLDDILIPARNWTEMIERLQEVLEKLRENGLTIKLSKCEFGKRKVEYLGFMISENGVEPGLRKQEAIKLFPEPTDKHSVQRFIGLASFFRRFIQHFATIAEPLTRLLRKQATFVWTEEQRESFKKIRDILTSKPILQVYNPKADRTELFCDASSKGLAAMMFQSDDLGKMHLVYTVSRRTSDTEKSYHSSRLELLCLVWAVERLRVFLIAIKFTIITDCQALVYLNKNKTKNPQIIRWYNLLSEYDFEIKHRSSSQMQHVDALSRAPVEEYDKDTEEEILDKVTVFEIITREEEIAMFQYSDEKLKNLICILKKNQKERNKVENFLVRDYKLKDGLLYKIVNRGNIVKDLYVVPTTMRKSLVIKYHDLSGHTGTERVLAKMSNYYYFPAMRKYIDRHIKSCIECILSKNRSGKQPGFLNPIPPGKRPFEVVHIDHLGPFVTSAKNNKYVLVIIDNLTKFVQLEAVKNTSSETTVRRLKLFIDRFGAPLKLISDRGTSFTSTYFQDFCQRYGINHILNSSRHPQANGMVERVNSTLLPMMQSSVINCEGRDWDVNLKKIERDINTSINKTTNKTPFELLYGYIPRFEDGQTRLLTTDNETYRVPTELREEVRKEIEKQQVKMKNSYDKHRYKGISYNIGDIVYVKTNPVATGESTKLQRRYKGPYVITKILPSDTYQITNLVTEGKKKFQTTVHVSQIKIWRNKEDDSDEMEEENECLEEPEKIDDLPKINKQPNERNDLPENSYQNDENDLPKTNTLISDNRETLKKRVRQKPKYLKD